MNTSQSLPAHLLPVQRHVVEWVNLEGETERQPFTFKSEALEFQRELNALGLGNRLLKV